MATGELRTVRVETGPVSKGASVLAAVVGLWVLVTPFVTQGITTSSLALVSTTGGGLAILVLAAVAGYSLRTASNRGATVAPQLSAWLSAALGGWLAASPFVLGRPIGTGLTVWSGAIAGLLVVVLMGYAAFMQFSSR